MGAMGHCHLPKEEGGAVVLSAPETTLRMQMSTLSSPVAEERAMAKDLSTSVLAMTLR